MSTMTSFDSPAAIPDTGKLSHIGAADIARVDELLTTTRAVRKRLDLGRPVSPAVIERCIEISLQAPTGSNAQGWHFIVVTDPQKRRELATLYASAFELFSSTYGESGPYPSTDPRARQYSRMKSSATHLMQHMHEVPVLVVPCIEGRCETAGVMVQASLYGSILPAVWSFILALRVRGLGTCWTTDHLLYEADAAAVLGVPEHVIGTPRGASTAARGRGSTEILPAREIGATRRVVLTRFLGQPDSRADARTATYCSMWTACAPDRDTCPTSRTATMARTCT